MPKFKPFELMCLPPFPVDKVLYILVDTDEDRTLTPYRSFNRTPNTGQAFLDTRTHSALAEA